MENTAVVNAESVETQVVRAMLAPLPLDAIVQRRRDLDAVMKSVMIEGMGKDYGKIPGCGDKPSLFKAGAEKLACTFQLVPTYRIDTLRTALSTTHTVVCSISAPGGALICEGVGEASSREEKYAFRRAVCQDEFDATPAAQRRVKYRKGYGQNVTAENQVAMNPADVANTVLKMAKKRAFVDGVLSALGASDMLTQDLDELPREYLDQGRSAEASRAATVPQSQSRAAAPSGAPGEAGDGSFIWPMGKNKGKSIRDVEETFLAWALKNIDDKPDLLAHVNAELARRGWGAPAATGTPPPPAAQDRVPGEDDVPPDGTQAAFPF